MHKANQDCITSITVYADGATPEAPIKVNRFITLGASGKVAHTGAGLQTDFVSLATAERDGEPLQGSLPTGSINKVEAGGVIEVGDLIASDATGRAIVAASGKVANGKAVTAAGAVGEMIGFTFSPKGTVA